ncbi:MAG: hypothetical protein M0Z58_04495 [Nitrospiraceae bacterium]|nr:hypothetical protein [Nitrospiraceae bacterium]
MNKIAGAVPIPKECMSKLVISLAAIAVFVLAAVVPGRLAVKRLDRKISAARMELDEGRSLLPLYETLKRASDDPPGKSAGPSVKSTPGDIPAISAEAGPGPGGFGRALLEIGDISAKSALRTVDVSMDLNDLPGKGVKKAGPVAVDMTLEGGFSNFRQFLVGLCALPYLDNIEYLSIAPAPHGGVLDFKTKIALRTG